MRYYAIGVDKTGREYIGSDHFIRLDGRYSYGSAVNVANEIMRRHGLSGYNLYRGENVRDMVLISRKNI